MRQDPHTTARRARTAGERGGRGAARTLLTLARRPPRGAGGRPTPPGRLPFIILLVSVLSAGLIVLLLLNTELSEASFEMQRLQASQTQLSQTAQALQQEIDGMANPSALAGAASGLGMVPAPNPAFINPGDGRVYGSPAAGVAPSPTAVPPATAPPPAAGTAPPAPTVSTAPVALPSPTP